MPDTAACPPSAPVASRPRRAPLPILGPLLAPIYGAAVARRNANFDAGRGVQRITGSRGRPVPTISVGNLTVGGTGKTPMVVHVLQLLLEHGHQPCVAMRGYSKSRSDTNAPDETDAYHRAFPDLPIVAQPDRAAGLRNLLARAGMPQPDCIVLDDGFQHRQLARDLDIVLIDATPGRSVFDDALLPAGWLREPVASLKRAHAVVLTHAELAPPAHLADLERRVAACTRAPIAIARHIWTALKQREGAERSGADRMMPLNALIGKRVLACCAIGHPEAFFQSLRTTVGAPSLVHTIALPDHDPYSRATIRKLTAAAHTRRADIIVVTDKDWSKLRTLPDSTWPCPVLRPDLTLAFDSGQAELDRLVLSSVDVHHREHGEHRAQPAAGTQSDPKNQSQPEESG